MESDDDRRFRIAIPLQYVFSVKYIHTLRLVKILSVTFENLNSLVGLTEIDLTDPLFVDNGIFAIVGPTGSGKTTILDAICLALFGRTPRLDKLSKSDNELMSRGTSRCFAEIVFRTRHGGTFRCRWEQGRARNKPGGNLKAPKHEISEQGSGEILESKISLVPKVVEEKTGLNFERFTRAMMLAQGEFAKFLDSKEGERADILEQITGTEIYGAISVRVHERKGGEEDKLAILDRDLGGVATLDPETLAAIEKELESLDAEEKQARAARESISEQLNSWDRIARLREEEQRLREQRELLQVDRTAFETDALVLAAAGRANEVEPFHRKTVRYREQLAAASGRLDALEKSLDEAERFRADILEKERLAFEEQTATEAGQQDGMKTIARVRQLDSHIGLWDETILALKRRRDKARDEMRRQEKDRDLLERRLEEFLDKESLADLERRADEKEQIAEKLSEGRPLAALLEDRDRLGRDRLKWREFHEAACSLQNLIRAGLELRERVGAIEKEKAEFRNRLPLLEKDRLHAEKTVSHCREQLQLRRRIRDLEAERLLLKDGKACPLCGAPEHPYAKGNVPLPDEAEKELERAERLRAKFERECAECETELTGRSKELERLDRDREKNRQECDRHRDRAAKLAKELDVEPVFEREEDFRQIDETVSDRSKRLDARIEDRTRSIEQFEILRQEIERLRERARKARELSGRIEMARTLFETSKKEFSNREEELDGLIGKRDEASSRRKEIFENKNPEEEERRLEESVRKARMNLDEVRRQMVESEHSVAKRRQEKQSTLEAIEKDTRSLEEAKAVFLQARLQAGFESEDGFLAAQLAPDRFKDLSEKESALLARDRELETLRKNNLAQRDKLMEAIGPEPDPSQRDVLLERRASLEEREKSFRERIGGLREQLRKNTELGEEKKILSEKRADQLERCRIWRTLHDLIGSHDGKKYRSFAQGLTFRIMMEHANRQLEKMSPRYRLVPGLVPEKPLEPAIIDYYQAGAVRTTKNLSGGERFLVSLALALGLSAMSSRRVRVDSLFLDEGFGTLDDRTLETALSVLEGLRREGKQIGIISHVPAIRERIVAQIRVTPRGEGRSTVRIAAD